MTTVEELQRETAKLPPEDFRRLADWFDELRADVWDREMEADAKTGKLDRLWAQAKREVAEGKARPLDELLHD